MSKVRMNACLGAGILNSKFELMFMAYNNLRSFRRVVTCLRKGEMFLLEVMSSCKDDGNTASSF